MRTAIHTSFATPGVIGKEGYKFSYDQSGDTVNTASRMESTGAPGEMNISRATHDLVQEFFEITPRGAIAAKNKGELEMFIVEGIKPKWRAPDEDTQPGFEFRKMLNDLVQSTAPQDSSIHILQDSGTPR